MTFEAIPNYSIEHFLDTNQGPAHLLAMDLNAYIEKHGFQLAPHRHNFYHLLYFLEARGDHYIDFIHFPVKPHQIYFIMPGQVHQWKFSCDIKGYIINFTESFFQSPYFPIQLLEQFSIFNGYCEDQVLNINESARAEIELLFKKIIGETQTMNAFAIDMIRCHLMQLFILVSRNTLKEKPVAYSKYDPILLRNFKKLVNTIFRQHKLPKEYAQMLHVTPNYLNNVTKEVWGKSSGTVIRERIILEAQRLLVNADLTITEIAYQLNFQDNSYFTKFFKKYSGMTPEQFRRKYVIPGV
jgi:AraC-like DNA-binding protein